MFGFVKALATKAYNGVVSLLDTSKPHLYEVRDSTAQKDSNPKEREAQDARRVTLERLLHPIDERTDKRLRREINAAEDYKIRAQQAVSELNGFAIRKYNETKSPDQALVETRDYQQNLLSKGIAISEVTPKDLADILWVRKTEREAELEDSYREQVAGNYIDLIEKGIARLHYERGVADKKILTETINRLIEELKERTGLEVYQATESDVENILKRYEGMQHHTNRPALKRPAAQAA